MKINGEKSYYKMKTAVDSMNEWKKICIDKDKKRKGYKMLEEK